MLTWLLDRVIRTGPWYRAAGYPFLLDTTQWLWFRTPCPVTGEYVCPYEIDSMAYIFDSLSAIPVGLRDAA